MIARRALLAGGGALLAARAVARPLGEVRESGWLRVAVYDGYRPFSWVERGVPRGIDAELGALIAAELGLRVRWLTRMAGETVEDDLRLNVWRGDFAGTGVADLMMHVPVDPVLARRADEVAILGAYFRHEIALAYDPAVVGEEPGFGVFERLPIGVEAETMSDFFLLAARDGRVRENVRHYLGFGAAADALRRGEVAAVLGQRGQVEGHLREAADARFRVGVPELPAPYGRRWSVGVAVKEDSRDLGAAVGDAIASLLARGEVAAICARHGVTHVPPG